MIRPIHHHHEQFAPLVPPAVTLASVLSFTAYAIVRSILSRKPVEPESKPEEKAEP